MSPDAVISLLVKYTAEWSQITYLTLLNPISRFELANVESSETTEIIGKVDSEKKLWLHPKLLTFALLSIVLGISINSLIQEKASTLELLPSVIIIFILWLVSASVTHLVCLILRGKGKYLETLSVVIQLSATLYVVTSFLGFIMVALLVVPQVATLVEKIPIFGHLFSNDPVTVFFLIGTILNMLYLPLAMKAVHKFGWIRTFIIAILPPLSVFISIVIYLRYGLLTYNASPPIM